MFSQAEFRKRCQIHLGKTGGPYHIVNHEFRRLFFPLKIDGSRGAFLHALFAPVADFLSNQVRGRINMVSQAVYGSLGTNVCAFPAENAETFINDGRFSNHERVKEAVHSLEFFHLCTSCGW